MGDPSKCNPEHRQGAEVAGDGEQPASKYVRPLASWRDVASAPNRARLRVKVINQMHRKELDPARGNAILKGISETGVDLTAAEEVRELRGLREALLAQAATQAPPSPEYIDSQATETLPIPRITLPESVQ